MDYCRSEIEYGSFGSSLRLRHGKIELIVPRSVGPRILSCRLLDRSNIFAVLDPEPVRDENWHIYGGHRLWHSPEDPIRTYSPDNEPVEIIEGDSGITVRQASPDSTGILKEIELSFLPFSHMVRVRHRLTNILAGGPICLAPWALTVMDTKGMAIVPQPPQGTHPEALLPVSNISLWAYTNMSDARWHWGEKYIFLRQVPECAGPQKAGFYLQNGWIAYSIRQQMFIKLTPNPACGIQYPDRNVNFELFANDRFLELESLGPMGIMNTGESVYHDEYWILVEQKADVSTEVDVARRVQPHVDECRRIVQEFGN